MADTYIFRIDHHGSLVRPGELAAARTAFAEGAIDAAGLRAVEDRAVAEAVEFQRKLHLSALTDGGYRQIDLPDVVLRHVNGVARDDSSPEASWRLTGAVEVAGDLGLVADTAFTAAQTDAAPAKAVLPSPAYLASRLWAGPTEVYATPRELGLALAAVVRDEIRALIASGVRLVQLDNPDYSVHYAGGDFDAPVPALGVIDAIEVDAAVLDGLERPDDVRLGICVDHGDYPAEDVDEQVAFEVFNSLPYDRFLIPYFSDVFAGQRLLQFVPDGVDVCLGIVDARDPELEDVDAIMARMDAAFAFTGDEVIAVSPNRGFQDSAFEEARLTLEQQRRKLEHVETIARMCWGNEL